MTEQENNNNTSNQERDWVEIVLEICVAVVLYFVTAFLFMRYVMRQLPHWFGDIRGPLVIIAPAIGWFIFMRYSRLIDAQRRRILSIVIFTFCAAILSVWLLLYYVWLTRGSY